MINNNEKERERKKNINPNIRLRKKSLPKKKNYPNSVLKKYKKCKYGRS